MATRITVFMLDPFSPKTRKRRGPERSLPARQQLEQVSLQLTSLMQSHCPMTNHKPLRLLFVKVCGRGRVSLLLKKEGDTDVLPGKSLQAQIAPTCGLYCDGLNLLDCTVLRIARVLHFVRKQRILREEPGRC